MRTRPVYKTIAAAAAILMISAASVLAMPTAASAGASDINTNSIQWQGVDDTTGYIEDAATYDLAHNSFGWNNDAFDGLPNPFTLHDTTQGDWQFVATTTVSDIHEGATSVITMTGSTTAWEAPYVVVLTLTLSGNYAHWSYRLSNATIGLANSSVTFTGNIGSDSNSRYVVNGKTLVSDTTTPTFSSQNSNESSDPIIGYDVVTNGTFGGWTTVEGRDSPRADAAGASNFDVYLVLFGYTPCANGFADAKTAVTALVPTLPATFGDRYGDAGTCITVSPLSLTKGVPVNQVLSYTIDPALTADSYFTNGPVSTVVDDLPAGLTATSLQQEDGSVVVTISGTPTTGGNFTARLLFAATFDGPSSHQVLGRTSIAVADPSPVATAAVATAAAVPELAATGTDAAAPMGLGGMLLIAGLGIAVLARRRRLA
ncbi:LPXTG cell wall anchor domain-containing protein [Aeromicrobium sp.]|uniref:LPXTG cell wall anchor domain-containing protein n=1 Tax=Aeromicrobium sp. TaxID=1871063 RepID=UPI0019A13487|nr:LPXTG cell wall anchor domain-containing protein [Aeromicrobium sp.]MBC7632228.1 LPXTG cell wall anchor domain-containing protein [Aeromicrobium sp.]